MTAIRTLQYGDHGSQYGELYQPAEQRVPGAAVVIHGGYWRDAYGASLGRPLARDLAAHGVPAWNLEYRRAGADGGGWPQTFADVAAGIDFLAGLLPEGAPVVLIGHSAGGHLASWAVSRPVLSPDHPAAGSWSSSKARVIAVISQSGLLDLGRARELRLSHDAVENLLGGEDQPAPDRRYQLADPLQLVPAACPVFAVHAEADVDVPGELSENYVRAAQAAGGTAELIPAPGDHFDLIDPAAPAWAICRELALTALRDDRRVA